MKELAPIPIAYIRARALRFHGCFQITKIATAESINFAGVVIYSQATTLVPVNHCAIVFPPQLRYCSPTDFFPLPRHRSKPFEP